MATYREGKRKDGRYETVHGCPNRDCVVHGIPITTPNGTRLPVRYTTSAKVPRITPARVLDAIFPIPTKARGGGHATADEAIETYANFEHLYVSLRTEYLTPGQSRVLFRFQGKIRAAVLIEAAEMWEQRTSDDPAERGRSLGPGRVLTLGADAQMPAKAGKDIPIRKTLIGPEADGYATAQGSTFAAETPAGRMRPWRSPGDPKVGSPTRSGQEIALRDELLKAGVLLCVHAERVLLNGTWYQVDFISPHWFGEWDGSYWHYKPENRDRDLRKTAAIADAGIPITRIRQNGLTRLPFTSPNAHQINDLRFNVLTVAATVTAHLRSLGLWTPRPPAPPV